MSEGLDERLQFGREQSQRFLDLLRSLDPPVASPPDRAWEESFHEAVIERFPEDSIVGEELPARGRWSGTGWLLDPIDGTTNLRHGLPWFCTSLAYLDAGRPVLGWVTDPSRGEIVEAAAGEGASVGGKPITLQSPASPILSASRRWRRRFPGWRDHVPRGTKDRLLGCTALEATAVARGQFGGAAWSRARSFDIAAGWLILREVGALLVGPGGVGLDSWTPLPIDEPGEGRVDLVVGHPDHGEWLESLARCAFSDE